MSKQRYLVSLRRRVDARRGAEYQSLWGELHAAAAAAGAHAWRFQSDGEPGLRLEFLEFDAARDPRTLPAVRTALHRLDAEVAPAVVEQWREVAVGT